LELFCRSYGHSKLYQLLKGGVTNISDADSDGNADDTNDTAVDNDDHDDDDYDSDADAGGLNIQKFPMWSFQSSSSAESIG
jgi:hypothetical protein